MLRALVRHEAKFIVVGGVAGGLAGSPLNTLDLDLVYQVDPDNCERLAAALHEIRAIYKDPAGRRIEPNAERLGMYRVNLLRTSFGDLDLLRSIGPGLEYSALLSRSREYDLEDLRRIRAIDLETLIEAKEIANRPKDHYALPFLKELLRLTREKNSSQDQA